MDKEKVTEELVRQNGNQAAAVMADYAGQGGGGASGGVITPPVDPGSGAAMLASLPEAGKIYNIPYFYKGLLVPVYIVSIQRAPVGEKPVSGKCLFCMYVGDIANTEISFDGAVGASPTLVIREADGGEGFLVSIDQSIN